MTKEKLVDYGDEYHFSTLWLDQFCYHCHGINPTDLWVNEAEGIICLWTLVFSQAPLGAVFISIYLHLHFAQNAVLFYCSGIISVISQSS